ncbi:MAG: hypothetical protein ACR5K4_03090 [Sodalis sp. (in: enterobacteria)]
MIVPSTDANTALIAHILTFVFFLAGALFIFIAMCLFLNLLNHKNLTMTKLEHIIAINLDLIFF